MEKFVSFNLDPALFVAQGLAPLTPGMVNLLPESSGKPG
jgi:hypothetical protein